MLGAREFALLPEGAVLINTARGGTMDFDALEAALRSGHLAAAGLDVMPVEPPTDPGALPPASLPGPRPGRSKAA